MYIYIYKLYHLYFNKTRNQCFCVCGLGGGRGYRRHWKLLMGHRMILGGELVFQNLAIPEIEKDSLTFDIRFAATLFDVPIV